MEKVGISGRCAGAKPGMGVPGNGGRQTGQTAGRNFPGSACNLFHTWSVIIIRGARPGETGPGHVLTG
jgi:hypothetical protein